MSVHLSTSPSIIIVSFVSFCLPIKFADLSALSFSHPFFYLSRFLSSYFKKKILILLDILWVHRY